MSLKACTGLPCASPRWHYWKTSSCGGLQWQWLALQGGAHSPTPNQAIFPSNRTSTEANLIKMGMLQYSYWWKEMCLLTQYTTRPDDSLPQWNDWKKHLPSKAHPFRSTLKIQGNDWALPFLKFFICKALQKGRAQPFPQTMRSDTAWRAHTRVRRGDRSAQGAPRRSLTTIHPRSWGWTRRLCHQHHLPCGSASAPREKTGGPSCRALSGNKHRSARASLVSKEK